MEKLCPVATSESSLMVLMDTYTTRMVGMRNYMRLPLPKHAITTTMIDPVMISPLSLCFTKGNWVFTVTCFVL